MKSRIAVKRRFTDVLAADSWSGAIPKMCALLLIFAAWKVLWNVQITGQVSDGILPLMLNGMIECLPFLLLSYWAIIRQVLMLKALSLRSRKDQLTGLNNRQTFLENAEARLSQGVRGVLLLIDADLFKQVNDTYGHAIGDNCIEAIGHRLHWNVREMDVAGRLGGEEFAILLHGLTPVQAALIAQRIGQPISFSSGNGQNDLSITMSIGMVETSASERLEDLLIMADDALYDAKKAGRAKLAEWRDGATEVIQELTQSGPIKRPERRKTG